MWIEENSLFNKVSFKTYLDEVYVDLEALGDLLEYFKAQLIFVLKD
jgi:hypothetical protein